MNRNVSQEYDRICSRTNSDGRQARLGATGKYYCGAPMTKCNCCNGYCGPTAGCNCSSCMKLDVAARSLPAGYLVNSDGAIARKGVTGKFYCGRKNMTESSDSDGYCGPTNGPNCRSCQVLGLGQTARYEN